MTAYFAALTTFCGVLVASTGTGTSLRRLGRGVGSPRLVRTVRGRRRLLFATAGCLLMALLWRGPLAAAAVIGAAGAGLLLRGVLNIPRMRKASRARQRAVIELCDSLASELHGGLPVVTAVERSCAGNPELSSLITAARLGGDIPAAMRRAADRPGGAGLRAVAAAFDVAGSTGAGLARVLERVAGSLRSDEDARAEVQAALGPPRATAKMLALLPIFGIVLGSSMGAEPVHFLVATSWGVGCLSAGALLALSGLWWVERLAASAEV